MRRWWLLAVVLAAALAGGCGSTATSPSSSFSVAGAWTGRLEYVTAGVTVAEDVTLVLLQPASSASGSWSSTSSATGTMGFTVASSVSGSFTINQPNVGSAACTGTSTVSGTASTTDLVLSVANLTQTATCPWATGMKFTLKK